MRGGKTKRYIRFTFGLHGRRQWLVVNACSFTLKPGEVYMVRLYCSQGGYTLRHKNTLRWKL